MDQTLRYLMEHMSFLYKDYGFQICSSSYSSAFGGDGSVVLANNSMRVRIISDRQELCVEFAPLSGGEQQSWYDSALILELITGEIQASAVQNERRAPDFHGYFDQIEREFSSGSATQFVEKLNELKQIRAKRLFG